jgi:hypothetical protein
MKPGPAVGAMAGAVVGGLIGAAVGGLIGAAVGGLTGAAVGGLIGAAVGGMTGATVGGLIGAAVGGLIGAAVGGFTGAGVAVTGASNGVKHPSFFFELKRHVRPLQHAFFPVPPILQPEFRARHDPVGRAPVVNHVTDGSLQVLHCNSDCAHTVPQDK